MENIVLPSIEEAKDKPHVSHRIISDAIVQASDTVKKLDEAQKQVQNQLQLIASNKIAASAQLAMLTELQKKLQESS